MCVCGYKNVISILSPFTNNLWKFYNINVKISGDFEFSEYQMMNKFKMTKIHMHQCFKQFLELDKFTSTVRGCQFKPQNVLLDIFGWNPPQISF